MTMIRTRSAPPRADGTIEALRGLGYTTETALADLIDNSISAGATRVDITFHWAEFESWVSIYDDGRGMSDPELDKAMRLAEVNPLLSRGATDLGRFGMGLKTASFSQCRRLTVASRKKGELSCLRWDLDFLANDLDGGWYLLEGPHDGSETKLLPLEGMEHGTLVLWEILDRIVTIGFNQHNFLDMIDRVERHLSMVFHRFLDRSGPTIDLRINGRKVQPWDPFFSRHPATWRSPEISIGAADWRVYAQAFVLPHKDRLSEKEYEDAAGPEGWPSQQGFYIYRGRRLLVAGSWLGLGRNRSWSKDESHRLARIRLDIPNSSDADWKIDIRKSTAHPPVRVREQLTRLAEDVRDRARRVFLHRAQSNTSMGRAEQVAPVWVSRDLASGRRYRVDRGHPAVKSLLDEGGEIASKTEALLRVLEETIPVQRIWLDTAESGEQPKGGFTAEADPAVLDVLKVIYRNLVLRKGLTPEMARRQLLVTEPFDLHPGLVMSLPDDIAAT
jgi:hypothetical protein